MKKCLFIGCIFSLSVFANQSVTASSWINKNTAKQENQEISNSKQQNTEELMERIKQINNGKKIEDSTSFEKTQQDMLRKNSVYRDKKIDEALVENKKSDEINTKPVFLEPLFSKVEIMPYQSSDGVYHEQQAIWIKVKDGEIVLKANSLNKTVDTISTDDILDK